MTMKEIHSRMKFAKLQHKTNTNISNELIHDFELTKFIGIKAEQYTNKKREMGSESLLR